MKSNETVDWFEPMDKDTEDAEEAEEDVGT